MALQLRRKGLDVPLLVILDSAPPVFGRRGKQQDAINETKLFAAAVAPPIALFRASDLNIEDYPQQYLHYFQHPTYTWDQIFPGQVECLVVPGDHITMLRQPNVDVWPSAWNTVSTGHQQHLVRAILARYDASPDLRSNCYAP